ncbi:MAG: DEAD/DEAH box helicase [Desulfobacterales bacterium]
MTDPAAIKALKALIPRAWYSFLARFGTPTRIQLKGIPAIMDGHPTLLNAPTASGKTEAFAAPIAEMILANPEPRNLLGWIVSPTRALVNDLTRRLAPPLSAMGLSVGRRTGEHREISDPKPPHIVVTTPESLDSLLARSPAIFLRARFLVLDEVHMLDATPRGDQLACLVSRLHRIAPALQVIASSATVDDPAGLTNRYLGSSIRRIQVPGDRPIEADFVHNSAGALAEALGRMTATGTGVRKVLVFVKRRADAERFFAVFKGQPPFGDSVFLHHGSLSRVRRETVERRMLTGTSGLCFATTTLEVGIDIGDIDLIVLAGPPPDVASLLQRMGRGSRRAHVTRICCLSSDKGQTLRYEHLLEAAKKGRLLGGFYHFCPSVLVQQCISLLMQTPNKWITAKTLASRMPTWLRPTGWTARLPELLDHLTDEEWLVAAGGRYRMGEKLEEAFEAGHIHSNFESRSNEIEVIEQDTRRLLGTLPRMATGDGRLLLGGRKLKVSKTLSSSRVLVTDTTASADFKVTSARGPVIHANLARDFARFIGFEPDAAPVLQLKDGSFALFHFLGSLWGTLLEILLRERSGKKAIGANAFCLHLSDLPEALPSDVPAEEIRAIAIRHRYKLRSRILEGAWIQYTPSDWRHKHLIDCLHIEGFIKRMLGMAIKQTIASSPQHKALVHLVPMSLN